MDVAWEALGDGPLSVANVGSHLRLQPARVFKLWGGFFSVNHNVAEFEQIFI